MKNLEDFYKMNKINITEGNINQHQKQSFDIKNILKKINPTKNFAAIMTCSDAEENCPFIPGVDLRIGTTYDDPKAFDNTELQDSKYDERSRQIALETFYIFSKLTK